MRIEWGWSEQRNCENLGVTKLLTVPRVQVRTAAVEEVSAWRVSFAHTSREDLESLPHAPLHGTTELSSITRTGRVRC